ncbi:MAG TPA: hypothetical protein VGI35_01035 [Steroidobacteraceae bacterium]
MSQHPPAWDEPLTEMRADARLRAFAKLDSLEPSRAVDRAVLGLARAAARGGAPPVSAGGWSLRWGFPAAVAAAAVCAVVVHRTVSRPGAPRVADQHFVVERMQLPQSNALEMVRVSAHYRGTGSGVAASAAYLASSGAANSHGLLIPSLLAVSTPLLSIRTAPPHKRGSEEVTQRVATRSSERASRRDRELTARRRARPPWLIDSVDAPEVRPTSPPAPALSGAIGLSSNGARVQDARGEATRAAPH